MKKWELIPNQRIGDLVFGTKRASIRKLLGKKYKEFSKTPYSKNTTDDYGFCHVYYDENDKFVAVEIFEDIQIYINDTLLFPINREDILKWSLSFIDEGEFLTSEDLSIGYTMNNDLTVGILVGKEGYYK